MRIFMVRLGMKGAQFALARKLMMKHLSGNSGWRYGAPPKKTEETPIAPVEDPEEAPVVPTEELEAPASDAPSDTEDVEESETSVPDSPSDAEAVGDPMTPVPEEAPVPEETFDTFPKGISPDGEPVPDEATSDSVEAQAREDVVSDEATSHEEDAQ